MKRVCQWGVALLLLSQLAVRAGATHRADFFDVKRVPTVRFDKGTMTWTLENDAIERVVRYDAKTGSLQTVSMRDKRHKLALKPLPNAEGTISFASPLLEPPRPLTGWKVSDQTPGNSWRLASFDDSGWRAVTLPLASQQEGKAWWFRCAIPEDRMRPGHAYVLLFDRALGGDAEIYVDGAEANRVSAKSQPWTRILQIDLSPKNRLVAVKLTGRGAANGLRGVVGIAESGTAPPPLDLSSNWTYMLHSVNASQDGSQVLSITLEGTGKYEGFDLDVNYQIYPGEEPTMAKWFALTSYRQTTFLIEEVVYDRWLLPGGSPNVQIFPGTGLATSDPATRDGLLTAVLHPLGASELSGDGRSVAIVLRPYYSVNKGQPQRLPRALTGLYNGPTTTGAFLYQLYIGQYVAHSTPTSVPPIYNTRYGYSASINAATCERIIPIAASLGVKVFVLGDGWQTNVQPDSGRYGDWVPDKSKFPQGLTPVANLAQAQQMRFGLWTAPIMADEQSQVVLARPEWLLRMADGSRVKLPNNTLGLCFTSGWEVNYSQAMQLLCSAAGATYLKLDGDLLVDDCVEPIHDHPVYHSIVAQIDHWFAFCFKLRGSDPNFLIDRGVEGGPEVTAGQDSGGFGEWQVGGDPNSASDVRSWYRNADTYRRALYEQTFARPPFTISWATPCHIPSSTPDLNALEYHFTSVGAYISNVEIQGQLEKMTVQERGAVLKWLQWNTANRPWLAYAQPLAGLGKPWDAHDSNARPHIDGVLHLRNALEGRYGYVCLWNPGDRPEKATVAFSPADYFVRSDGGDMQFIRLKDGRKVSTTARGGTVTLPDVPMAPRSWEIFEIRQRGK
jgi:hypothetical protein